MAHSHLDGPLSAPSGRSERPAAKGSVRARGAEFVLRTATRAGLTHVAAERVLPGGDVQLVGQLTSELMVEKSVASPVSTTLDRPWMLRGMSPATVTRRTSRGWLPKSATA